jgi:hypothetical protein
MRKPSGGGDPQQVKYDDASWHYGGQFPEDLPPEAGARHTGMFVAWAMLAGLASELHTTEIPEELEKLRSRVITPGAFFLAVCDGKFTDEDLNDEGNAFAQAYFNFDTGSYLKDYDRVLTKGLPSQYHVQDTWANFETLRPVLDKRLHDWRNAHRSAGRPWWKWW